MAGDGVEIGTAYVTILPDGSRVGPEVKKSFGVVDQEADRAGKSAGKKFGGVFSTTASKVVAGAGGIFAAAKAKDFLGESIGIASDLNEAGTKLDAIFGKAQGQVQKFAAGGARALGQSRLDVLDAAATFGVFGKAAGLQGPKLAKFSTRLTKLSTDIASFQNAEPSEVVEALGAALRGEAEPMRRFGVLLDDASLKAEAMSLGILKPVKDRTKIETAMARLTVAQSNYNKAVKDNGKDSIEAIRAQATLGSAQNTLKKATEGTIPPLTAQQKTLAAQSLIFKQTRDAQGDFERTSAGLANQQRILKARFEDLKGEIGQKFLPIAVNAVTFLNDRALPVVEDFIDGFSNGKGAGGKARRIFEDIREDAEKAAGYVKKIGDAFNDLPDPIKKGAILGAAGLALGKKTGLLGSVNGRGGGGSGLLGLVTKAKPLPVFVVNQLPTGALGAAGTAAGGAGSAAGAAGAAAAGSKVGLLRFGIGGALASVGGVRTYTPGDGTKLGNQMVAAPDALLKYASKRENIDNYVKALAALDQHLTSLSMQRPLAGFREFQAVAKSAGVSTADLAKALPNAARALDNAGYNAKQADAKTFGFKETVKDAGKQLEFLSRQQPRIVIKDNAAGVKKRIRELNQLLDEAAVPRTARIELAKHYNGTGFGIQRASGGPAYAGQQYTVNEHLTGLREQFVPGVDGRILSRRDAMAALAGGRGGNTFNHFGDIVAPDPRQYVKWNQDRARRESGGGVNF